MIGVEVVRRSSPASAQPQLDRRRLAGARPRAGSAARPSSRRARGLTVAAPWTTWSLIPSFGYARCARRRPRAARAFVSLSQNSASGGRRRASTRRPSSSCSATSAPSSSRIDGVRRSIAPRPGVAEPERRQHVERRRLRARVADADPDQHVLRRRLGVVDRDLPVAARRRRPRCRPARTRDRACRGRGSRRAGARTGTRPAGTCSASASTSASGSSRGTTSTPWRPRRGCPRGPVSPKIRSLRIGSRPFQNASAKQSVWRSSQMPPSPSSFQR